jgi:hypothetical protein
MEWWQTCKEDCPYRLKCEEISSCRRQICIVAPACKGSAALMAFQEWLQDLQKKLEKEAASTDCTCSAFATTDDSNFNSDLD